MARYIASAVVISIALSMAGFVLYRYVALRSSLEASACRFAALIRSSMAQLADVYGEDGLGSRAAAEVTELFDVNPDVSSIWIVWDDGRLALSADHDGVETWPWQGSAPTVDHAALGLKRWGLAAEAGRVCVDGRRVYRVVEPVQVAGQDLGLSLVAIFSYDRVNRQLKRGALFLVLGLVFGLVVAGWVSMLLARHVTRGLGELQRGVRRIRAGRLDVRVDVSTDDEIQELAEAFNGMTEAFRRSVEGLRRANQELQALDQAKADLVANVSHELLTPLTALKGFLELLDDGELGTLGEEAHRAVTVCRRNVDRLALRVGDLIQLAQMEKTWPEEPAAEVVDVGRIIAMIAEIFEIRLRSKNLSLAIELPEDLPAIVAAPDQIERVVINLLDNAVKFTPEGGSIVISVEECDHEARRGVLIKVMDTGIGIPAAELVRIFDRFHQVDPSIRRRYGGMGLGLALVHHIVECHGGIVWAESDEGSGASFLVWLPLRQPLEIDQQGDRGDL